MVAFEMSHYFIADVFGEITMRVLQAHTWIWSPQPAFCQHASLGGNQAGKPRTTSWLLSPSFLALGSGVLETTEGVG